MKISEINIYYDDYVGDITNECSDFHLICFGSPSNLQWFGTKLIQKLAEFYKAEISSLYGRHINNLDDFCYQLCRSTPWGFEMGRSPDAVVDVLRGETYPNHKFFMWFDADNLYTKDYEQFRQFFEIFLEVGEEVEEYGTKLRTIILLEEKEEINIRKLISDKDRFPIKIYKIDQFEVL